MKKTVWIFAALLFLSLAVLAPTALPQAAAAEDPQIYAVYNDADGVNALTIAVGTRTEDGVLRADGDVVSGSEYYTMLTTEYYPMFPEWSSGELRRVVFLDPIAPEITASWFAECPNLEEIEGIGLLDTSNVKDMTCMFCGCSSLTALDVSGFDTSNVKDMSSMFAGCSSLTALDVSRFDTANVTAMHEMFEGCSSLTELDVSGFDTSNVRRMYDMFTGCSSLTVLDVSGFDTSSVTDEMDAMFEGCSSLTELDLSGFDTSHVPYMRHMFKDCSSLVTLDVSSFDTVEVRSMEGMFDGCASLRALDLRGFDTSTCDMVGMFRGCASLSRLTLGERTTFNVYADYDNPELPSVPVTDCYTGKWVMEDGDGTAYTSQELMETSYRGELPSGTWVWECTHPVTETKTENETAAGCVSAASYDTVVYCADCGKELSRTTTVTGDPLGHGSQGYEITTVPSTCVAQGYTLKTCVACGETVERTDLDPAPDNHVWGEPRVIKPATDTEEGLVEMVCTLCGETVQYTASTTEPEDDGNDLQGFWVRITTFVRGIIDWFLRLFRKP